MGALSPLHLVIILVVALLVIGPGKLPETGAALGRAIRDFRNAMDGRDETPESVGQGATSPQPGETSETDQPVTPGSADRPT
jgi:sec-independent protein translocase protein TatA